MRLGVAALTRFAAALGLLLASRVLALRPLPPEIAAARAALTWPARRVAPMEYATLDVLRARRAKSSPLTPAAAALARDPDGAAAALGGGDHARVAVACLLLGGGGADECHALVTPLCWDEVCA